MIILLISLFAICYTLFIVRLFLVHAHVSKRIDEVYDSKRWYEYPIDIDWAYDQAIWDVRKWTYRDFYPEVVQ